MCKAVKESKPKVKRIIEKWKNIYSKVIKELVEVLILMSRL